MSWEQKYKPRYWQEKAFASWNEASNRGVVEVVTGGGKTFFAFQCIHHALKRHSDLKVLIVVPTTALLDQWCIGLSEDYGLDEKDIATFSGDSGSDKFKKVNVCVINTARKLSIGFSNEVKNGMLIVDECHRAGSPINSRSMLGKYVATLGLSATPRRQYDEGFEEYVVPSLGKIIYSYSYEDALEDGVIVPFDLFNVQVSMLDDEQQAYDKLTKRLAAGFNARKQNKSDAYLSRILMRRAAISANATMRIPTAVALAEKHSNKRIIIFHERVEAANKISEVLNQRGKSAVLYHSRLGESLRRSNLKLFRKGVYQVLVTCRALDEGTNVPETEMAIVAASTSSTRQRIQRMGRVLRPAEGKGRARIYTLYASKAEEQRLYSESKRMSDIAQISWLKSSY